MDTGMMSLFIMVIYLKCRVGRVMISPRSSSLISEVSCGARNDKSPEAVACTPEPSPGQRRDPL